MGQVLHGSATTTEAVRRAIQHSQASLRDLARRVECDVFEGNDPTLAVLLDRQGVVEHYQPEAAAGLDATLFHPQHAWHSTGMAFGHMIGNNARMAVAEMPKSFAAIADAKWRGQLAWASPNYGSSQLVVLKGLLEMHGWDLIEALARNQTMIVRGWPEAENAVATGERQIAGDVSSRAFVAVRNGVPFELIYPEEGVIVYLVAIAITKAAPRPNAARLLVEFCLSDEGQRLYMREFNYPIRRSLGTPEGLVPLANVKQHNVNWDELLDQRTAITRRWTQLLERN
jgi:iron(III) transport system substrate-binding protein